MFVKYRESAKRGCAESQFRMGFLYENLDDDPNSKYWYEKAAMQNHSPSQLRLGFIYAFCLGDFESAKYWFKRSQVFVGSMFYLGWIYELENNIENSIYWYKLAAESGHVNACYILISLDQNSDFYLNKIRILNKKLKNDKYYILGKQFVSEKKIDEAITAFRKSISVGTNCYSMYELGNIYRITKNRRDSELWYKEASMFGEPNSLDYILIIEARKIKKIIPFYVKFDSHKTNYILGSIYMRRCSYLNAITYFMKAAIQNSLEAHIELIKYYKTTGNIRNLKFWCSAATILAELINTKKIFLIE